MFTIDEIMAVAKSDISTDLAKLKARGSRIVVLQSSHELAFPAARMKPIARRLGRYVYVANRLLGGHLAIFSRASAMAQIVDQVLVE